MATMAALRLKASVRRYSPGGRARRLVTAVRMFLVEAREATSVVGRWAPQPLDVAAADLGGEAGLAPGAARARRPARGGGRRQGARHALGQAVGGDVLVATERPFVLDRDPQRFVFEPERLGEPGRHGRLEASEGLLADGQLSPGGGLFAVLAPSATRTARGPQAVLEQVLDDVVDVHTPAL